MNISVKNLYVDFGAIRVKVQIGETNIKGAVSRQSSSFCLILPITRPQSLWNLK